MNEQLLSWQIKCVWLMMRREREVFKMKTASWELCVSWGGGEGMQGRLCREMTPDLGLDVEEIGV